MKIITLFNESYQDSLTKQFPKQNFEENSLKSYLETCRVDLDKCLTEKYTHNNHSTFMNTIVTFVKIH